MALNDRFQIKRSFAFQTTMTETAGIYTTVPSRYLDGTVVYIPAKLLW